MRDVLDLRLDSLTGDEDDLRSGDNLCFFQPSVPTRSRPFSLLWIRQEGPGQAGSHLSQVGALEDAERLRGHGEWALFELIWASGQPVVASAIEAVGGHFLRVFEHENAWRVRVGLPSEDRLTEVMSSLEAAGVGVESTRKRHAGGPDPPTQGLTPTQLHTLEVAYRGGYFEVPRQATLEDLSGELGITDQAVSARLRRALGNLVARELAYSGGASQG